MTHIEKMKQWLEAMEEAVHYTSAPVWSPSMTKECNEAITSLRQAIAEAEGQEKALQALHNENERLGLYKDAYAEPVIDKSAAIRIATVLGWEPKREWVGLTDEEIDDLAEFHGLDFMSYAPFTRDIEAKLKEQNT